MQIEKALINDPLSISSVSWEVCIPLIYHFEIIYSRNLPFSSKGTYFLTVFIVFSGYKENFKAK